MRSQLFIPFILLNVLFQATACSQQPAVNTAPTSNQSAPKENISKPPATVKAEAIDSQVKQLSLVAGIYNAGSSSSKKETGNLLTSEQKAKLLQLPIPIVAPTFLPDGFRLVYAKGEANKYVNGDDDSGYTIDYQGENNTCISIRSSSSGSRGLQRVNQVQTEFGSVVVYTDNARDNSIKSISGFLALKGNPMLMSGGIILDRIDDRGFKRCEPVEMGVYIQVLKSVTLVK